jgi:hypothetical protein
MNPNGLPGCGRLDLTGSWPPEETIENVSAWDDPLDVASMSHEQRDALKRELLRQHPHLAQELTDAIRSVD